MGILNIRHGRKLFLASAVALLAVAGPAIGHADETDFASYGDWTTSVADDSSGNAFCTMHTSMRDGGTFSVIADTSGVWVRATDPQWHSYAGQNADLDVDVDGHDFSGVAHADGTDTVVAPIGTALIEALEDGEQAELTVGTEEPWNLDLTGTADATFALSRGVNALQNA